MIANINMRYLFSNTYVVLFIRKNANILFLLAITKRIWDITLTPTGVDEASRKSKIVKYSDYWLVQVSLKIVLFTAKSVLKNKIFII